jgi:hypothetical protein
MENPLFLFRDETAEEGEGYVSAVASSFLYSSSSSSSPSFSLFFLLRFNANVEDEEEVWGKRKGKKRLS